ncbi:hypothetical protein HZH66_007872 [Vespula vulgaris]|uniref:Uncharacterized protein n=2 Tax=Vespula TaxID=7451 RepID=A0A834N554_VESVU|nr:hypothetical protein HZH66_007872 [Vespula vulgaris]
MRGYGSLSKQSPGTPFSGHLYNFSAEISPKFRGNREDPWRRRVPLPSPYWSLIKARNYFLELETRLAEWKGELPEEHSGSCHDETNQRILCGYIVIPLDYHKLVVTLLNWKGLQLSRGHQCSTRISIVTLIDVVGVSPVSTKRSNALTDIVSV